MPAASPGPLANVRVIDLCVARAGPTCVRQLADLGADVIQVVRPEQAGVDTEFTNSDRENLHRNKRSIALDLQTEAGRDVFLRLVATADIVVENFRSDVKYRLRIDYETLREVNPRLVYGSISGYGQDGPYATRPGFDPIAQAVGGLMSVTGPPGGGPWRVGIPIADLTSGMFLAQGILAALYEREHSGVGQWVHTSLIEAIISMLDFQATRWLIDGEVPPQAGNDHPTVFPAGAFPTKDGMIVIAVSGGRIWQNFVNALAAPEIGEDERFREPRARSRNRAALRAVCEPIFQRETSAYWVERLNEAGVPCGEILDIAGVFADPQVQHLGIATSVESPRRGELTLVRSPVNLNRTPTSLRSAAPVGGEHTDAVLGELGYTAAEIGELRAAGVLGPTIAPAARSQA